MEARRLNPWTAREVLLVSPECPLVSPSLAVLWGEQGGQSWPERLGWMVAVELGEVGGSRKLWEVKLTKLGDEFTIRVKGRVGNQGGL